MSYQDIEETTETIPQQPMAPPPPGKPRHNYPLHILLFVLTLLSTSYAGIMFASPTELGGGDVGFWELMAHGLPFGLLLMLFLTAHEFGHYFAARAHGVDATLPYYIPMPIVPFGTFGAVIRTRSIIPSRKALFDIGVAGPIAGFVVAFIYLVIGMATLPGIDWLYSIHPEYRALPSPPDYGLHFGGSLIFDGLRALLVPSGEFFPGTNELYHNPFLAIGWFGMFVTALNMIPVGQLDGGHILYAMFGRRQHVISRWIVRLLILIGIGSLAPMVLELTQAYSADSVYIFLSSLFGPPLQWLAEHTPWWFTGWSGWLFWVLIIKIFIRVPHPDTPEQDPLDRKRMIIGWIALGIFVLCFSYRGIYYVPGAPEPPEQIEPRFQGPEGDII